jgi:hypothetical protein
MLAIGKSTECQNPAGITHISVFSYTGKQITMTFHHPKKFIDSMSRNANQVWHQIISFCLISTPALSFFRKSIWYSLKKGPEFVAKRKTLATDVTREHLKR